MSATLYATSERAERLWRRVRDIEPQNGSPLPPAALVPDPGCVLQVYPVDRRLPSLRLLSQGPPSELEPSLRAEIESGAGSETRWLVERLRYRTGLSAVLRYEDAGVSGSARDGRPARIVKIYKRGEAAEARRRLVELSAASGMIGFHVPRVVAYLPRLEAVAQEPARGEQLGHRLASGDSGALVEVAEAVARFNLSRLHPRRRFTPIDEMDHVRRAASILSWAMPELRERLDRVTSLVAARLEEVQPAPIHRDLKDDHVFVGAGRPWLVDTDSYAAADPVLDPATFIARLRANELMNDRAPGEAAEVFAHSYFRRVPREWRRRLPEHYAGALVGAAQGVVRRQEPGWRETAATLLKDAEQTLAGRTAIP